MSLYRRDGGDVYWYEFRFQGRRIRESTNTTNRAAARDIEAAKRIELAKGEAGIVEKGPMPTVAEYSEIFKKQMESEHSKKPKTKSYYFNSLRGLALYTPLQKARLDCVERHVDGFIAKRRAMKKRGGGTISVASVNRELETLRRMLYCAQKQNVIDRVPRISRIPGEVGRDRVLSCAEEQAYLAAACPLLRDIGTVLIDTALRPEEAFRMTWENVHFKPAEGSQYGRIFNPFGKTKLSRRTVSMTARVAALLSMRHEAAGKPKTGWAFPADTASEHVDSLKSQHRKALKVSGVKAFVLYDLRHSMLTRLGEAGCDSFTIQKIAGHASITTSAKYVHPSDERLEGAFARLAAYNAKKEAELKAATVQ
ncbi:MAG: site-specific integrase [Candidatus Sulfotelmatobacter sp.]